MLPVQLTSYALADRAAAYRATIEGSIAMMEHQGARVLKRLEEIRVPTRVIVGRNDVRADWQTHVAGVARMPQATLSIYEGCGHLPFMEHADRFNREARDFLERAAAP
jgi:pimeloyl-ACP methyl ester carboxylesterase